MCRSIKVLRRPEPHATPEEVRAAALQFVRKISGFPKPSRANQEAFDRAVNEITEASGRLLYSLQPRVTGMSSGGSAVPSPTSPHVS